MSKSAKYDVIHGIFLCHGCGIEISSARFYPTLLDLTWKCKSCDHTSEVSIKRDRGY